MECDSETTFEYMYNQMNYVIGTFFLYSFGITLGAFLVSKYAWNDTVDELEELREEYEEELYEEKYPLNADISGNKPTNTCIIEFTPDGSVIMSYDYDQEGFHYWSDVTIKYNYLETAARKFVKMNGCADIYIDRKENIKKQNELLDKEEKLAELTELKELTLEVEESVFVKSRIKKKEKVNRNNIAANKANKYIRIGKFSDFKWLKEVEVKTVKKICFSDFKNMKQL
tara:strand:+ start:1006 stop:1689 length:684 start_codon:yes stop_codon:yes gene_type:complete